MVTNLNTSNVIPTNDPYTGTKSASNFTDVVDWVQVEIRDASTPTTVLTSQSGLLKSDGYITDANAGTPLPFDLPHGNYHIAIKHRNHLSIMTGTPINLN